MRNYFKKGVGAVEVAHVDEEGDDVGFSGLKRRGNGGWLPRAVDWSALAGRGGFDSTDGTVHAPLALISFVAEVALLFFLVPGPRRAGCGCFTGSTARRGAI